MKKSITIIGAGKVGSALAFALIKGGYKVKYLIDKDPKKFVLLFDKLKDTYYLHKIIGESIDNSDVVIICVRDSQIGNIINKCVKFVNKRDVIFLHTSGTLTSEIFTSAGIKKKNSASFHPVQTFTDVSFSNEHLVNRIYFGIEGGKNARLFCMELCERLKSNYILLNKKYKIHYHIACILASNFLVTNFRMIELLLRRAAGKKSDFAKIFKPIIDRTLDNIYIKGAVKSLTGPIERNDAGVIENHVEALKTFDDRFLKYYTAISAETVKIALEKGSIGKQSLENIQKILNKYGK
ncbi:DUF2520 domain-containing protein [bacterium]|nr:MAG: DUF2520 domain-containing protein [bacterium]